MKNKLFIPAIFITVLLFPFLNFGQTAPVLGKAADFVLFTASGSITNTGVSNFIGNVGSNTDINAGYQVSGFGNINGQIHNADGVSSECYTSLTNTYNNLSAEAPTKPDPSIAGIIGNGNTLTKGVYSINEITLLSGNLILDGEGDPNAVFIFKISSAFSSVANSKIILENSALACNVFWQISGNVTLLSATSFKGTIIANGSISFNAMDTLEGRALTLSGAVTTTNTTAAIPVGCGSPYLTGPMRPVLGTLIDYVLYTEDGQIGNGGIISRVSEVGPSYIVGNIGVNFGVIAGFEPPSQVIGDININNAATAQAKNDLDISDAYINTLPYYTELLYPSRFGNDLVLTPHTYLLNNSTFLTGNLILDAQGNPDAIFVILINGNFLSTAASQVVLRDSAKACNVFWKIDGSVSLGETSVLKGTIISNSTIDLQLKALLDGRAFTTSGNITLDTDTARIPTDCLSRPLPLTLIDFNTRKINDEDVLLTWKVQNESDTKYFTVEASDDINNFHTLGSITTKDETNNTYTFTDKEAGKSDVRYYRLKIIDKDGSITYSAVRILKFNKKPFLLSAIYPNPVQKNLKLNIYSENSGNVLIMIINMDGKKIFTEELKLNSGINNLNKDVSYLSKGMYLIKIIKKDDGFAVHGNFQKL